MLEDHQIKIVMLAHELEKTLGELYTLFKEKFPEHSHLWDILIREEHEHAEAVQRLYRLTYQGDAIFEEGVIKAEGVRSVIDYLKNIYEDAMRGKFSNRQVLSIALDMEKSLFERDIFEHFEVASPYSNTIRVLRQGAQNHLKLIEKELERVRLDGRV